MKTVIKWLMENKSNYDIDIIDDSEDHNIISFYFSNALSFANDKGIIHDIEGAIYNIETKSIIFFKDKDWETRVGEFYNADDVTKIYDLKNFKRLYLRRETKNG